jgi:selenide, water dikinase
LPAIEDDRLLVGHSTFDDAGIFRLTAELALVQTIDFFPPVIDDPFVYGQVAAANSLSDVYAMGGEPLTALSLVCFPNNELDLSVLGEILRGGGEKCREAGCTIVGGHSVRDAEIKFGFAVTGTVHPDKVTSNAGAKAGDRLILTKSLGMGALTTAYRKKAIPEELMMRACQQMATLNKAAAACMRAAGIGTAVHAATDITGFGLLGHSRNIAAASDVTIVFRAKDIPVFEGALDFAGKKMTSGAYKPNQELLAGLVALPANFDERMHRIIYDSETSGGLLMSVAPDNADTLLKNLKAAGVSGAVEVGSVEARGEHILKIV